MTAPTGSRLAPSVVAWYAVAARDLPWRRPGFTAWGTLVSETMLQQTPVARVIPRLAEWLDRWPTPARLAEDPPGEAVRAWDRLGYPRRALNLHRAATLIVERHDGRVPSDVDDLLALPGVGPYTARAVAVFAFGLRHPVVDTNVRRVIARAVDGVERPGPVSTRRDLAAMDALLPVDRAEAARFDAAMMELGAIVCTARSPRCDVCPIAAECTWRACGYPREETPRRAPQRYDGSDRQARGRLLAVLRGADRRVEPAELVTAWPEEVQRARALAGLVADGLVVETPAGYALPG